MTEAKEKLKACIEKMDNENMIEKIHIFIMGMRAQQCINEERKTVSEQYTQDCTKTEIDVNEL